MTRLSQLFTKDDSGTKQIFNPIVDEADVLPKQSETTNGLFLKSNGTNSEWAKAAVDTTKVTVSKHTITETEYSSGTDITFDVTDSVLNIVFLDGVLTSEGETYTVSGNTLTVPMSGTDKISVGTEIVVYAFQLVDVAGAKVIVVDSALSTTSTNPVQNKVIASKISELESAIAALSAKS